MFEHDPEHLPEVRRGLRPMTKPVVTPAICQFWIRLSHQDFDRSR
ncbi:hypothetical protein V4U86_22300 [Mycobacterium sp. AMU20-3851]